MSKAQRVTQFVHSSVLEVDTLRTARACVEVKTTFVKDDICVDKMSGPVVPPIRLAHDSAVAVVAEEDLILIVQCQRRAVGGPGVDELDIGVALRTPRLGT